MDITTDRAVDWEKVQKALGLDQLMWRKRIILLSKFIDKDDNSVLDVGAGNMYLKKILPENTIYYPLDYVKRCEDTLVYNINHHEFPDIKTDVAVLAGIIEYIEDIDWFFDILAKSVNKIVLSYKSKDGGYSTSLFTTEEIINKLVDRGFIITGLDKEYEKEWPLMACLKKAEPKWLGQNIFCTGCGACANICPSGAINMEPDSKGFLKPYIDAGKCCNCDKCVKKCPAAREVYCSNLAEPDCYAAWSDDKIRNDSSSGGVFTVLAEKILDQGGIVYGAAWTSDFHIRHIGIFDKNDIKLLRHSKYVQSNTLNSFQEVRTYLEDERPVLYTGTPCQIAGLKSFLGRNYAHLITVDFICFCVTPVTAFRKYLADCFGIENIRNVIFRDKYRGWNADGYTIWKTDGQVLQLGSDDYYQKAFHSVLCRNNTCEECRYADFPRQGDITLGDFWGIDQHDATWNDNKGTSMVLLNSEKGNHFFSKLKDSFTRLEKVPLEWTRGKGNRIGKDGRGRHTGAERFFHLLPGRPFPQTVETVIKGTYDIGLVCLHNNNYGNNLTNYALYCYLNELGYTVLMINHHKATEWKTASPLLSLFAHVPYNRYDLAESSSNKIDLKKLNHSCDKFLLGSDQLLRAIFVEGLDFHSCMDWVASNKIKLSYGSSFGTDRFEGDTALKSKMNYFLKRFDALSVREETGVEILKKEFDLDAQQVLDPVFLCDDKYYEKMASCGRIRIPSEHFLGAYILDSSAEKEKIIQKLSSWNNITEYQIICDGEADEMAIHSKWGLDTLPQATIEEWLANILYSQIFLTDSFHGLCFALIFHKDFWIISEPECWRGRTRLESLLKMVGLEERLINSEKELQVKLQSARPIDYKAVTNKLSAEIAKSKNWLSEQLKKPRGMKQLETYDILGEKFDSNMLEFNHLSDQVNQNIISLNNLEEKHGQLVSDIDGIAGAVNVCQNILNEHINNSTASFEEIKSAVIQSHSFTQESYIKEESVQREIRNKLDELQSILQTKDGAIDNLLDENILLNKQLRAVYESNSWRITAGFRMLKDIYAKFLKSLQRK